MKKALLLLAVVFLAGNCSKKTVPTEPPKGTTNPDTIQAVHYSYNAYPCQYKIKSDSFTIIADTGKILIQHHNYCTLCDHVLWSVCWKHRDILFISENDSGPHTMCFCYYPLYTRIDSLNTGQYRLLIEQWATLLLDTLVSVY